MASTIKQRLRRYNGTDYDTIHLETHANNVWVGEASTFVNPLNTDQLTLGMNTVYFTAYPDLKWQVQHLDGNYVYLALYPMAETSTFGSSTTYSGSTIATKCTTYLNSTIPNVADYLESVTVNGVTAKVFIPSYDQLNSEWDWPKAGTSNRICQLNGYNKAYWTSTANGSSYVWYVNPDGDFRNGGPSVANGFRPAVKVRYKDSSPEPDTLDNVLDELKTSVSNGKSAIASAITDKGVSTSSSDSFSTMATNIGLISTSATITSEVLTMTSQSHVTSTGTLSKSGRTLWVDCFPIITEAYHYWKSGSTNPSNGTSSVSYSCSGTTLTVTMFGLQTTTTGKCYATKVTVYYID